jgi:nucleoside-diphosphate-sugar epimerase
MNILVIGGTRFFGIHMVDELLSLGHEVTIASRGLARDPFGEKVKRIILDRTDPESIKDALSGKHFDVVIDKIAYCSNDIKNIIDFLDCEKYIYMSTTAVYDPKHPDTVEEDFDPSEKELVWCDRGDFPYDVIKRSAEAALAKTYGKNWVAVRYPVVLGKDDYTKRLMFYVEHTLKGIPMNIDNPDHQMSYIRSDEAGKFMAFLVSKDFSGPVNGASSGTVSLKEILRFIEERTGKKALLDPKGDAAPYNGDPEFSINTKKAESLGFRFTNINDWIYDLIDHYIELCQKNF